MTSFVPIIRAKGITTSERYLQRLADHTFLSMWSYAGVHRKDGGAKEVADLLVIFEEHVLIFSDKHCKFPETGDLKRDWSRWYRRAVASGAKQVAGAERCIRRFPDNLFLDASCSQRFPLPLPDPERATYHRIVVAHGAAARCCEVYGGSGSLMLHTNIVGDAHMGPSCFPFAIGHVDPEHGYVHVFDDTSLPIVLDTLDTVSDFVTYLSKKEELLTSGLTLFAAGEEDLMARYLMHTADEAHDFSFPDGYTAVMLPEGEWDEFSRSQQRLAQLRANQISYGWDAIIERFSHHMRAGTSYTSNLTRIEQGELILRFLARENRTRRRMLSSALVGISHRVRPKSLNARMVLPDRPGDPHYVLLALEHDSATSYEEYRERRRNLLESYCLVVKFLHPAALDIVGLATETRLLETPHASEDLIYLDGRHWDAEAQEEARRLHEDVGLFGRIEMFTGTTSEYPNGPARLLDRPSVRVKGRDRNQLCPCGSGRKFKHCHGKRGVLSGVLPREDA